MIDYIALERPILKCSIGRDLVPGDVGSRCVAAERDVPAILAILDNIGRRRHIIGHVFADPSLQVRLPRQRLISSGKEFRTG
jgi:hypothetical protein